jgi:hypothetical protein
MFRVRFSPKKVNNWPTICSQQWIGLCLICFKNSHSRRLWLMRNISHQHCATYSVKLRQIPHRTRETMYESGCISLLHMLFRVGKNANVMCSSLLVVSRSACVVRTLFWAVHCSTQCNEEVWPCAPLATSIGNVGVSKFLYSVRIKFYQTL